MASSLTDALIAVKKMWEKQSKKIILNYISERFGFIIYDSDGVWFLRTL